MNNLLKIKTVSKIFHLIISGLILILPLYYTLYWAFINHLPATLITVNTNATSSATHPLSIQLQAIGFVVSLFPLSALTYGLLNIRKLFSFYKKGVIFSYEHVNIFKKTSKALLFWVFFSIVYESAKSVLFTLGNPPGQRVFSVGISSPEITILVVAGIVFVIAWVMDEGRILTEESRLTV
ncbi:MAG: DUF2975 domain-containing protein [Desulfobacterales bacterium]|nr:DUF2975 domain-containing protein [Desulfobacterales bacterium]